jgi:hypothetical protein
VDHRVHFLAVDILNLFLVDLAGLSTEANRSPFGTISRQVPLHTALLHGSGTGAPSLTPCSGLCDEEVLWAPRSSIRFSTLVAMTTSVACRPSVCDRSPPPMTRFQRAISNSARARQPCPDAAAGPCDHARQCIVDAGRAASARSLRLRSALYWHAAVTGCPRARTSVRPPKYRCRSVGPHAGLGCPKSVCIA